MVSMGMIIIPRRARIAETFLDMSGSRNIDGTARALHVYIIVRRGSGKHRLSAPRCLIVRQPTRRQPYKDHPAPSTIGTKSARNWRARTLRDPHFTVQML